MKKILFLFSIFILATVPLSSSAAELLSGTEINLPTDKTYSENLYIVGGRLNIDSSIDSDLVVLGGEVNVSSSVTGDVFILGGKLNFSGATEGDVRVIGGEVNVSGTVGGDLLVIGGEVDVSQSAEFASDILVIGGNINFDSDTNTELKIIAGKVSLNNSINGIAEITTQKLSLNEKTKIFGDLFYYAPQRFQQSEGVEINGTVYFNEIQNIRDTGFVKQAILSFMSFWFVLKFITTIIISFILIYVFKIFSIESSKLALESHWKSLLAGILTLIISPIVILLFFASLFALPIGFLILLFIIFIVIVSPGLVGIFTGAWIRKFFGKDKEYAFNFKTATIGVLVITFLEFVPVVGNIIKAILFVIAVGAMIRYIRIVTLRKNLYV